MADYEELVDELISAQCNCDTCQEQGYLKTADIRRVQDAKKVIVTEFVRLELENAEQKKEIAKLAKYLKELRDRYNAKVTNG